MEEIIKLTQLQSGETAIIEKILGKGRFRHRLLEMGFQHGIEIYVEKHAPLQDPIEYILKGYHISLRSEEADYIMVKKINQEDNRRRNRKGNRRGNNN